MKDQLVTFETAKLAKEKGCDIHSVLCFSTKGIPSSTEIYYTDEWIDEFGTLDYYRHTQSLLQKWLREKHNIEIVIHPIFYAVTRQDIKHEYSDKTYIDFLGHETDYHKKKYFADVQGPGNKLRSEDTYEQALEKGLQEGLKLIKDNK